MTEMTLKAYISKFKVQLMLTFLAGAIGTAALVALGVCYWEEIKEITVLYILIKIIVIVGPLMGAVAYFTYAERKFIGYMQMRIGPNRVGPRGWLQPIADALKLLTKEIVVPTNSSRFLFVIAPMLSIAPALAAWYII